MQKTVSLQALVARSGVGVRQPLNRDAAITGLTDDSRAVQPGDLFVAVKGEHADGHAFVEEAVRRGAAAVAVERDHDISGVPVLVVADTRRALSSLAAVFFGDPSRDLMVVGVTGTNGKTTTVHFVAAALEASGVPCGIIGTLGARWGNRAWDLGHTTPPAHVLQRILAEMRDAGARAVAMEVSSHALALDRVADVHFAVGAFTNLTRDHLDFHGTFEAYAAAKRRLFDLSRAAVLNADDPYGAAWADHLRGRISVVTYALDAAADLRPSSVGVTADGTCFVLAEGAVTVRLPGRFNVLNALAALGVARALGVDQTAAARGIASVERVPGRMERLSAAGIRIVVDYAHTPDALERVLQALREETHGALAVVFGCGGDRDRGKRPQMGRVAARLADRVYLTSDNPRSEDPQAILAEIVAGMESAPHAVEPDRAQAIARAVTEAERGDTVLIAGKGHERMQIVGSQAVPFDDVEVARAALSRREAAR
jgi:UDP-N-acetylmuramoyl-L-alanyl-D-glutamate--2,6-diaminopimelate ligase